MFVDRQSRVVNLCHGDILPSSYAHCLVDSEQGSPLVKALSVPHPRVRLIAGNVVRLAKGARVVLLQEPLGDAVRVVDVAAREVSYHVLILEALEADDTVWSQQAGW